MAEHYKATITLNISLESDFEPDVDELCDEAVQSFKRVRGVTEVEVEDSQLEYIDSDDDA